MIYLRHRRRSVGRSAGFVLVVVLFTLVLVSITVVGFASRSMQVATDALQAQQAMQLRWGVLSSQRVLMKRFSTAMRFGLNVNSFPNSNGSFPASLPIQYRLGEIDFLAILSDESAKLDLNSMARLINQEQLLPLARKLTFDNQSIGRWEVVSDTLRENNPSILPLVSWDQVFQHPDGNFLEPEELIRNTESITLWGGKINFQTASEEVLSSAIVPLLGSILADRIIAIRSEQPDLNWSRIKPQLDVSERQSAILDQIIDSRSHGQSLWLVAQANGSQNASLMIRRRYANSVDRIYTYYW